MRAFVSDVCSILPMPAAALVALPTSLAVCARPARDDLLLQDQQPAVRRDISLLTALAADRQAAGLHESMRLREYCRNDFPRCGPTKSMMQALTSKQVCEQGKRSSVQGIVRFVQFLVAVYAFTGSDAPLFSCIQPRAYSTLTTRCNRSSLLHVLLG